MTVELRPLGVQCNIACQYCYQNPQRDVLSGKMRYDMERMKKAILEEGGPFTLFGGEPLMLPLRDLDALWDWGRQEFGRNRVQTNGTLITERHIELFKRHNVHVGISIDGPGALNDVRWVGSLERTRRATASTEAAIERLCLEGRPPSLIVTLHRGNATASALPEMVDWMRRLDRMGIRRVRLHLLESDDDWINREYALSHRENIAALTTFAELEEELYSITFDLFQEIEALIRGDDRKVSCTWRACDPHTTEAVRGVEGNGQRSNCGRTNKDGVDMVKAEAPGFERYVALYRTPQEEGGCQGCRFFLMCKGQCPGTSIQGDWRQRTEHCAVWMALFERAEARALEGEEIPLSRDPLLPELERLMIQAWATGQNPRIWNLRAALDEGPSAP